MEARHAYQGTPCIQRWQTFDFIVGVTGKVFSSWNKGAEEDYSSKRGVTNHYLRLGPFGQQHINSEPFSLSPLGKKSNSSEHSKLCGGKREEYLVHVSSFCWRLINRVLEKGKIGCMCLLFSVDWKINLLENGKMNLVHLCLLFGGKCRKKPDSCLTEGGRKCLYQRRKNKWTSAIAWPNIV